MRDRENSNTTTHTQENTHRRRLKRWAGAASATTVVRAGLAVLLLLVRAEEAVLVLVRAGQAVVGPPRCCRVLHTEGGTVRLTPCLSVGGARLSAHAAHCRCGQAAGGWRGNNRGWRRSVAAWLWEGSMRETRGSGGRKERHGSKGQGTKKEEHANEKGGEKSSGSGGGGKGGSSDPPPARKGTRERVAKTPLSPMQNTKPQKQSKKSGSANGSGGHGAGGGSANADAEAEAAKPPPAARPPSRQADGQAKPSRSAKNDRKLQSDAALVAEVRTYMKANKLSQVTVGQEARISQAVISQWLSLKYHGHNDKVRPLLFTRTRPRFPPTSPSVSRSSTEPGSRARAGRRGHAPVADRAQGRDRGDPEPERPHLRAAPVAGDHCRREAGDEEAQADEQESVRGP